MWRITKRSCDCIFSATAFNELAWNDLKYNALGLFCHADTEDLHHAVVGRLRLLQMRPARDPQNRYVT